MGHTWLDRVRRFACKIGLALSFAGGVLCAVVHIATFFTMLPLLWMILPAIPLFAAAIFGLAVKSDWSFKGHPGYWKLLCLATLVYSLMTLVYYIYTTEGASSVGMVDGRYISLYKDRVIRSISEYEFRMFPNLWTRVMTAWLGMLATVFMMVFSTALQRKNSAADQGAV